MVLPVVDKFGALLDVDVIRANVKHYSNVALVLRRGEGKYGIHSVSICKILLNT